MEKMDQVSGPRICITVLPNTTVYFVKYVILLIGFLVNLCKRW